MKTDFRGAFKFTLLFISSIKDGRCSTWGLNLLVVYCFWKFSSKNHSLCVNDLEKLSFFYCCCFIVLWVEDIYIYSILNVANSSATMHASCLALRFLHIESLGRARKRLWFDAHHLYIYINCTFNHGTCMLISIVSL